MAELIDPFDEELPGKPTAPAVSFQSDLVDPFDSPEFIMRPTGQDVRGGEFIGERPLTPTEQQAADIRARVKSDVSKSAGPVTTAKASFADDPEIVVRTFAEKRFPELPVEEAMQRYAVIDDEIIYKSDDGNLYREVPEGWSPGAVTRRLASVAGPAIPATLGGAAGVISAPLIATGPAGAAASIAMTAGAGAAGEAMRQKIGEQLTGDPVSAKAILAEGALSGAAQGLGAGLVKFMGRNVARDIGRIKAGETQRLQQLAGREGISLTPAELTNLPSLKAQQKALGNIAGTSDDLAEFYAKRAGQAEEAVGRRLEAISPVESTEVAGGAIRSAAERAMSDVAAERAAKARPLYERAFREAGDVDVNPVLDYIDTQLKTAKGDVKSQLQKARSFLMSGDQVDTSIEGLHQAKLAIDDVIQSRGETSIGNVAKARLQQVQNRLLRQIDEASPDYAEARKIFADLSPEVTKVREGLVGVIADLDDRNLQKAASSLFNPEKVGPLSVREAKSKLTKADPDAWNAIKRAWLQENWEKAGREFASSGGKLSQGAKFRASMVGDAKRERILKEMLEPDEFQALKDLTDVLDAAGRVKPVGSDTAWNQELMRMQREEATPGAAKLARIARPQDWGRMVEEWATERSMRSQAKEILDVITSPQGIEKLKQLRKVRPGSAKAAAVVSQTLRLIPETVENGNERLGRQVLQ